LTWRAYQLKRGSFNLGRRLEAGFALLAHLYTKRNGGTATMEDFMPHERHEEEGSIEAVARMFGAIPAPAKED
jgi:hypothetical protein